MLGQHDMNVDTLQKVYQEVWYLLLVTTRNSEQIITPNTYNKQNVSHVANAHWCDRTSQVSMPHLTNFLIVGAQTPPISLISLKSRPICNHKPVITLGYPIALERVNPKITVQLFILLHTSKHPSTHTECQMSSQSVIRHIIAVG